MEEKKKIFDQLEQSYTDLIHVGDKLNALAILLESRGHASGEAGNLFSGLTLLIKSFSEEVVQIADRIYPNANFPWLKDMPTTTPNNNVQPLKRVNKGKQLMEWSKKASKTLNEIMRD